MTTRILWRADWPLVEKFGWLTKCGYDGAEIIYRVERGTTEYIEVRGRNASIVRARLLKNIIFKEQE